MLFGLACRVVQRRPKPVEFRAIGGQLARGTGQRRIASAIETRLQFADVCTDFLDQRKRLTDLVEGLCRGLARGVQTGSQAALSAGSDQPAGCLNLEGRVLERACFEDSFNGGLQTLCGVGSGRFAPERGLCPGDRG